MTKEEMKTKFATLYGIMTVSPKVANMKLFGDVMCDMMYNMIDQHPEHAEEYIGRLCAVKWNNYLTEHEADAILSRMRPAAHWTFESFVNTVQDLGGSLEQKPCYNKYALFVAMNMIYSDSADSIASIIGHNRDSIPESQMANAVYLLATDKLCDEDGVFSVRKYFSV